MADDTPEDVLRFWFPDALGEDPEALGRQFQWWFAGGADAAIIARFTPLTDRAARGDLASWAEAPHSRLALILVLDQFSRSVYRGTPRAYAQDEAAVACATEGLARGDYERLSSPFEKTFFLLAFGHSEELRHLDTAVALAKQLARDARPSLRRILEHSASQARGHREVVARFGRQPHRNAVLGRESTPEEREYLARGEFVHQRPVQT